MRARAIFFLVALVALLAAAGCTSRQASTDLRGEESALPTAITGMAIPLDLREFEVVPAANGARGVFLKLSRLPTGVTHRSEESPARIVLDITGPTGAESPLEVFPAHDDLVTHITYSRQVGSMQVVLELAGAGVPAYEVLPMAEWILVRLKAPSAGRPWSHRAS